MKFTLCLIAIAAVVNCAADIAHGRILRSLITLGIAAIAVIAFNVSCGAWNPVAPEGQWCTSDFSVCVDLPQLEPQALCFPSGECREAIILYYQE